MCIHHVVVFILGTFSVALITIAVNAIKTLAELEVYCIVVSLAQQHIAQIACPTMNIRVSSDQISPDFKSLDSQGMHNISTFTAANNAKTFLRQSLAFQRLLQSQSVHQTLMFLMHSGKMLWMSRRSRRDSKKQQMQMLLLG